jgi:hypothetical protein
LKQQLPKAFSLSARGRDMLPEAFSAWKQTSLFEVGFTPIVLGTPTRGHPWPLAARDVCFLPDVLFYPYLLICFSILNFYSKRACDVAGEHVESMISSLNFWRKTPRLD